MPHQAFPINFILIYFVYGLAFFSMGLAMLLESRRSPLLAEGRALRPLAFFGFLHGIHEWLEMFILIRVWANLAVLTWIPVIRLALLVLSFSLLLAFGLIARRPQRRFTYKDFISGLAVIAIYLLVIILVGMDHRDDPVLWVEHADAFSRYLLAVPGAVVAAYALFRKSRKAWEQDPAGLAPALRLAAWGFVIYSLTQVIVPAVDIFPASFLNTRLFLSLSGVPIQVVRAGLAVVITVSLIRASQVAEAEREHQLQAARQARLEALEQVRRELVEREALRRELLRHTVIAQEEERARIARELHDETAQLLTALRLNLSALHQQVPKNPEFTELIERLQTLSRQMSAGIYRMVHDLRPAQLDDLGLVAALQYLADEEHRRSGLVVDVNVDGTRQRMVSLVETVFFRIAQEALTNVSHHAHCDRAAIQLQFAPQQAVLRIIDQGVGFDLKESQSPPRGWGLAGMRERADSVGAQLNIQSAPGRGTHVELVVSLIQPEYVILEESSHEYRSINVG
jgi:signal transduction histidine kinase